MSTPISDQEWRSTTNKQTALFRVPTGWSSACVGSRSTSNSPGGPTTSVKTSAGVFNKYANRCRRLLLGGHADKSGVSDDDGDVWTLNDSKNLIASELDVRLTARRRQHVHAVRTFLPRILQRPEVSERSGIVMHRCAGCVVFSDASGFTKLTETLAQKADGAEVLSKCLNKFFTPLIDIIEAYRGDVIKFSGDALSILFEATDDYQLCDHPCGSPDAPRKTPFQLACLRGAACCLEIHKRLHNFDTGEGGVCLTLHIGVGAGDLTILKVGGEFDRYEYVIAGTPMEQISIAEPLAGSGESVLSPECWGEIRHTVIEGRRLVDAPEGYKVLAALETKLHTYPTVKQAAMECTRIESQSKQFIQDAELQRMSERFIPRAVLKHLRSGNSSSINEMRSVTIIFSQIGGVDVSTDRGSKVAQQLMTNMQRACYTQEGNLNKFLVDDKGLLFLFVFGLPPLMHTDDPTRAVAACFEMAAALKSMNLVGRFGVTTGRVFCGIVGSDRRREYTVMGDTVNLSARLMAKAPENSVLIDEATYLRCAQDITCKKLEPFMVKGKAIPIQAYAPTPPGIHGLEVMQLGRFLGKRTWGTLYTELTVPLPKATPGAASADGSATSYKVKMPWRATSQLLGGSSPLLHLTRWRELQQVHQQLIGPLGFLTVGGSLTLTGHYGSGKEEICEFLITEAIRSGLHPLFGVMEARVADQWRAVADLMQNCILALLRDESRPQQQKPTDDDVDDILRKIVGRDKTLHQCLAFFGFEGFEVPCERSNPDPKATLDQAALEIAAAEVCALLVNEVSKRHGVCVVLRMRRGTDLFDGMRGKGTAFWAMQQRLSELAVARQEECTLADEQDNLHPILVLTISREKPKKMPLPGDSPTPTKVHSISRARELVLGALTEDAAVELMCHCLGLSTKHGGSLVKRKLREYVSAVSIKIPVYIQECLEHLLMEGAVVVKDGECNIIAPDLNAVNIAEWVQTSMVGGTISQLESLKSAQNHIMKMATVFEGPFSALDLAAANRVLFGRLPRILAFHDQAKLLSACSSLVEQGLLKVVPGRPLQKNGEVPIHIPQWTVSNSLFRKVAGCMLLNSQRILIKRAVLIERALNVEIPKRIRPGQKSRDGGRMQATGSLTDGKDMRFDATSEATPFDLKHLGEDGGVKAFNILVSACCLGNVRTVVEILKLPHLDINKASEVGGYAPLHFAASGGEVEIVHLLCERSAHVNAKSHKQETPLYLAAVRGHLEIVQYLCEWRGALDLDDTPEFWERALPEIVRDEDICHPLAPGFPLPSPLDRNHAADKEKARQHLSMSASDADAAAMAAAALRREVLTWLTQKLRGDQEGSERPGTGVGGRGSVKSRGRASSNASFSDAHASNMSVKITAAGSDGGRPSPKMHSRDRSSRSIGNLPVPGQGAKTRNYNHGSFDSGGRQQTPTSASSHHPNGFGGMGRCARALAQKAKTGWLAHWRSSVWRTKVRAFLRGKVALVVMLIALAIALFLPDIWVATSVPNSLGADVVLAVVMSMFATELILLSVVDSSYPFSFFFFMDCVGTISMVSDISFFLGSSASEPQTNQASQENLTIFRATRTAKIGARAGRLSRLVKVMKFLPGMGNSNREQEQGEKLQQISNQLTNVLSKRVAFLTIVLVIVMPLFSLGAYPEADFSSQVWMEAMERRVKYIGDLYDEGECDQPEGCSEATASLDFAINEFAMFYLDHDYGPYRICIHDLPFLKELGLTGCRPLSNISGWTQPARGSFRIIMDTGHLAAEFDYSRLNISEANLSLWLITLVIVLMCGACTFLNYAASELAVRPLERMLASIKKSAKAIFRTVSAIGESADGDEDFAEDMDGEVALLERVVRKIATLAEISSKKNLFDDATIASMKTEELGILALTALHAAAAPKPAAAGEDMGTRASSRAEISVTMQWQLEEIGLLYEKLNSWEFNVLDMTEKQQAQISGWLLMNNPGSCNYTELNVDSSRLRDFVEMVVEGYMANAYHNFMHAVDATHTVFRYLVLMEAEQYLSMLDQFALLIASVGHDLGHIGLNNGYLTETHHELAIRYNDRSPLENMHCCKLFEILARPAVNLFSVVGPAEYREARKTIIDVILHTDITAHPGMLKELELLYEMNSLVFELNNGDCLTPGETEILSESANKKLILKVLLHSADISNPTKPWNISREWSTRVLDEYALQGDQEKQLGIPVQALNDRERVNRPSSQIGFIEYIINPWWLSKVKVFPVLYEACLFLEVNLMEWENLWLEGHPTEAEKDKMRERVQRLTAQLRPLSSKERHSPQVEPIRRRGPGKARRGSRGHITGKTYD